MSLELNYRINRINWNIDQTSNGSFFFSPYTVKMNLFQFNLHFCSSPGYKDL